MTSKEKGIFSLKEYNLNPNLCKFCGKPIYAPQGKKLYETKLKKFCSKSCAAKLNNKGNIKNFCGNNGDQTKIDDFTDEEIIGIFKRSISIADFSRKLGYKNRIKYGSTTKIGYRLKRLNLDLDSIKNTSDFVSKTKSSISSDYWIAARTRIGAKSRSTYMKSDKPKYCVICGYSKHFEVAHIKAVSDFDENTKIEEINDVNNLIALCPNHHWEYDNMKIDISQHLNNN